MTVSDLSDLTPDQIADLIDIAERYRARRSRDRAGATVRRHNWTPEQAKLSALHNSKASLIWYLSAGRSPELEDQLHDVLQRIAQMEAEGVCHVA